MKFAIKHEIKGRIRIHLAQKHMTYRQADILQCYLEKEANISKASVYVRTQDVAVVYTGSRDGLIRLLSRFSYETAQVSESALENSGRELNETYKEKLINSVVMRTLNKMFLPYPVRVAITTVKSVKYIYHGVRTLMKGKLEVPVLDATAIGVSMLRGDFNTAGSTMFLLGIGEILEEWTHKKSVNDLARSMSINAEKVWFVNEDGQEVLISASSVKAGDLIRVHMGNVIPFDGNVVAGEAMVNQTSLTGESAPVRKAEGSFAYAGTVLEEGELTVKVKEAAGSSRYEKIVNMIEDSEKLKSSVESNAEHLADRLVPYTLAGTGITYLLTRNMTKTLAVLMVDFSCALKLAMPVSVLSAIREASTHSITVKGGKYMEAMADATTIVFDKTGTLTNSCPTVEKVLSFGEYTSDEILKIAACLEEHFPHSVAKAIVKAAKAKQLDHEEEHAEVEYVVAHGIATMLHGKRAIIGSEHFVLEDENIPITDEQKSVIENECEGFSVIYLAIGGVLSGVICISDPPRSEAHEAIQLLRESGIDNIIMLTGDHEGAAKRTADMLGIDNFRAQVLPEDKATIIEELKNEGRTVIMVGDGINDSPALALSDVSIAMKDSADLAREVADVTLLSGDLRDLALLRKLSSRLFRRIKRNYTFIMAFNSLLILLGLKGSITPSASSLLHNSSTMLISANSMRPLLKDKN